MMTPAERAVLARLIEAWNAFIELPIEHGDDVNDFRYGLHVLERQVLARPARRLLAR